MQVENIFEVAKSYRLKDYLTDIIGLEIKRLGSNSTCPFCEKKNKFGVFVGKNGIEAFQCWSSGCGKAGDIINFVSEYYKLSAYEAAQKILSDMGMDIERMGEKEYQKRLKEREEANRKKLEEQKEEEEKNRKKYLDMANTRFKECVNTRVRLWNQIEMEVKKVFPYWDALDERLKQFIGWDSRHKSVVIGNVNREKGVERFFNLKTRTMEGCDGKWISTKGGVAFPFPFALFDRSKEEVWLCEGEKDAIALIICGLNALTLGGVGNKWDKYKKVLEGKKIYLFYDHDRAGYINYIHRVMELKNIAKEMYVVPFFYLSKRLARGYDVSDYICSKKFYILPFEEREGAFKKSLMYAITKVYGGVLEEMALYVNAEDMVFAKIRDMFGKTVDFEMITKSWIENVVWVKGEIEEDFSTIIQSAKASISKEKEDDFKPLIEAIKNLNPKSKASFSKLFDIKNRLLKVYRQIHSSDAHYAVSEMCTKSKHPLYNLKGGLVVWSGKHFLKIPDGQMIDFLSNIWVYKSGYQIKSHTERNIKEMMGNLKVFTPTLDFIQIQERVLNLSNGVLLIDKYGRTSFKEEHSVKYAADFILDFEYDPTLGCPKWDHFLKSVLGDERERDCVEEYLGYCLMPNHLFESFLFLVGAGGSGKSTILNMFKTFFNEDKISNLQMQQFFGHELDALEDKFINIGSELDAKMMIDGQIEILKALVSAKDTITVNPKHKDTYTLSKSRQPKLIFAGNKKPTNIGDDSGVFRRLLMITFDNPIEEKERVEDIGERFKDELGGILNRALKGIERLLRNGCFSMSGRMVEEIENYRDDQNPLRVFFRECIFKPDIYNGIEIIEPYSGADIYESYKKWCGVKGHNPLNYRRFYNGFIEEGRKNRIKIEKSRVDGKRVLTGFKFNKEAME